MKRVQKKEVYVEFCFWRHRELINEGEYRFGFFAAKAGMLVTLIQLYKCEARVTTGASAIQQSISLSINQSID